MAVTNYHTLNGEIIAETTGGVRTDYLSDTLGSVVATVNQSAQVVNTYRYKPYGVQLAKTGAGADPAFRWVGNAGYRQTGKKWSDVYVRARHYELTGGRWTTVDPIWPSGSQYCYVMALPTLNIDPTGLRAAPVCCCCPQSLEIADQQYFEYPAPPGNPIPRKPFGYFIFGPFDFPKSEGYYSTPKRRGWYFEVKFKLDFIKREPPAVPGDCTMEWHERRRWYCLFVPIDISDSDRCVTQPGNDQCEQWNAHVKEPCPTTTTKYPIWDVPNVPMRNAKGQLYCPAWNYKTDIRIVLKASKGCVGVPDCPN